MVAFSKSFQRKCETGKARAGNGGDRGICRRSP